MIHSDNRKLIIDCLQSYIAETLKDHKAIILCAYSPLSTIKRMIFRAVKRAFEDKVCMVVRSIFEMAPLDNEMKKILKDSAYISG